MRPVKNRSQSARPPTARATSRMPKKGIRTTKKIAPERQESGERAAAEVGDAGRERPALEPGFDRFLEDMESHQHDCEHEGVPEDDKMRGYLRNPASRWSAWAIRITLPNTRALMMANVCCQTLIPFSSRIIRR